MVKIVKRHSDCEVVHFDYSSIEMGLVKVLKDAAKSINIEIKTQTESVIRTGKTLLSVKSRLDHGLFSRWVREELCCTVRTAENYMLAASLAEESKSETISRLPPTAVYKLAAPSMPADAKLRILGALADKQVSIGEIEAKIRLARKQANQDKKAPPVAGEQPSLHQAEVINEIAALLKAALSQDVYRRVCALMTSPIVVEHPATLPPIFLEVFDTE